MSRYVNLLNRLQAADERPLEVDVPFWYGTIASSSGVGTLADCPNCTFVAKGLAALTAALTAVDDSTSASYASYAGVAVHDVRGSTSPGA